MKILLAGTWRWPWYEESCARILGEAGHAVTPFAWKNALSRVENRILWGPGMTRLGRALESVCDAIRPDLLFVYRGTHFQAQTLRRLKARHPNLVLAQYCNDDPFSPAAARMEWRHLREALPFYDVHFVYRHRNIQDFMQAGARRAVLLRSYFVPWLHHPLEHGRVQSEFLSDVVFVGHHEPDGREAALDSLRRAGVNVKVFGAGWPRSGSGRVRPVLGEEYSEAVAGAKIALSFLSRLNRDTYTRRNFEIPAIGSFMLSEYSDDLASLFAEGREAEYFRDASELVEKVRYYLAHDDERLAIARAGRARLLADGHGVADRMREMVRAVGSIRAEKQRA